MGRRWPVERRSRSSLVPPRIRGRRSVCLRPVVEVVPRGFLDILPPEGRFVPGCPGLLSGRGAFPPLLTRRRSSLLSPPPARRLGLSLQEPEEIGPRPQEKIQNEGDDEILHGAGGRFLSPGGAGPHSYEGCGCTCRTRCTAGARMCWTIARNSPAFSTKSISATFATRSGVRS